MHAIAPALGTPPKFGVCASSRARLEALGGSISRESAEWLGAQRLSPPPVTLPRGLERAFHGLCLAPAA